jgi:hypothetical protein
MTFLHRLKQLDKDPTDSPYYRKTNNKSGSSGPVSVTRDHEIIWENGQAKLLHCPKNTSLRKKEIPETTKDSNWTRYGYNSGTLPSNPNAPIDGLQYVNKDTKISEEKVMSYINRLAEILAKTKNFNEMINILAKLFPKIKMRFPNPPTYIWNPNEKPPEEGEPLKQGSKEPLDPQAIKDQIKTKIPEIVWETRMTDGVEAAELGFSDGSVALLEIGLNANHLTVTYVKAEKQDEETEIEDTEDTEDTQNAAFKGGI